MTRPKVLQNGIPDKEISAEFLSENANTLVHLHGDMDLPLIGTKQEIVSEARDISESCGYGFRWVQIDSKNAECQTSTHYAPVVCLHYEKINDRQYIARQILPAPHLRPGYKPAYHISTAHGGSINTEGKKASWGQRAEFENLVDAILAGLKAMLEYLHEWNLWEGLSSENWQIASHELTDEVGSFWYIQEIQKIDFSQRLFNALKEAGQEEIGKKAKKRESNDWGFILASQSSETGKKQLIFWRSGPNTGQSQWVAKSELQ